MSDQWIWMKFYNTNKTKLWTLISNMLSLFIYFHILEISYSEYIINGLGTGGRVTHICTGKLAIICSDSGLSPGWCQAIMWTNAGILLIGSLVIHASDIPIIIHTFSLKKLHLKISSVKWHPLCLGPNVLRTLQKIECIPSCLMITWTVANELTFLIWC